MMRISALRKQAATAVAFLLLVTYPFQDSAAQENEKKATVLQDNAAVPRARLTLQIDQKAFKAAADLNRATESEVKDLAGEGPSNQRINLATAVDFVNIETFSQGAAFGLEPRLLCPYNLNVYPDVKRATGIFYYYPRRYFIKYDQATGYQMEFTYTPQEGDDDDTVIMVARLSPGFSHADLRVFKELLRAYLRNNGYPGVEPKLFPLPATYEPKFDLSPFTGAGGKKTNFLQPRIDPSTGDLSLTLETNLRGRQVLTDQLGSLGIVGEVVMDPQPISDSRETLEAEVSTWATLHFYDDEAYYRANWVREEGEYSTFRNSHVFPVVLKHLVYLRPHAKGVEVRGYNLGGQVLQPGDVARIPNTSIAPEIDDPGTLAAWYHYTVNKDEKALEALIQELTGGTGAYPVEEVALTVLNPAKVFDQYGISKIEVAVRSAYFDPDGKEVLTQVYELNKQTAEQKLKKLYLWDEAQGVKNRLLYEYLIRVVMQDGSKFQDSQWRKADSVFYKSIDIGEAEITALIGETVEEPREDEPGR